MRFERSGATLQITKVYEFKIISEYFTPYINQSNGWIYRLEDNKCVFEKTNVLEFKIKNVVSCVIINSVAYVADENGCVFEIDLESKQTTRLDFKFSTDTLLYNYENKLLISAKDEFYREAYIYSDGELEKVLNCPKFCFDIFVYKNNLFYLCYDVSSRKNNIRLYKLNENVYEECFHNTDSKISLLDIRLDFNKSQYAYWYGKKVIISDFLGNIVFQFKVKENINDICFIKNGEYLLILTDKKLEIKNTVNFATKGIIDCDCFLPQIEYEYESGYVNLITDTESILFNID